MMIVWLAALAVTAPLGFIAWSTVAVDRRGAAAVKRNLATGTLSPAAAAGPRRNLWAMAGRLAPKSYAAKLDRLLAAAGRPRSMPLERLIGLKTLCGVGGVAFAFLHLFTATYPARFLVALAVTVLAYFVPDLLVRNTGQKRQQKIMDALPDTLDQLLISVEAGLGFEGAVSRVASKGGGPLNDELMRTLQELQMGRPRQEAYLDLATRNTVPELRSFIRAVVQADVYGIAIANVLRVQAKEMRLKRRQRAEEKAMKIPVKILFPLMFFILPVLFIIVLGPAVMGIINTFSR
ncbi:type II secretion system F family protein [Paenarthrobacter sp. DKR-5]|uniref:type II secretion system F family protein n=1 Tax=Paenarthrobacter sp. DKR-5 TaxID=2835535 RepID=UPI001BDC2C6F|nr:type II secretion system F family protein [Paenarthrobacter sp. DKR-5]MBT1001050.1 type II secretion system F family protein [Paenarthrobacter sp. DKR-5]